MSFANLKKQSRSGSLTDKLIKQIEKLNDKSSGGADDRIWKPTVDKSGNGYAIIRFLPEPEGCDLPFVKVYSHAFQGPGGWLIDQCLTTKDQKCPVCEHNSQLWNSGVETNKEIARKQKRKLSYYSNIYVVSDPGNPENEGKVFLYKYGKKIFDKISAAMKPEFADEEAINPFDFWSGANFKLKIRKVAGYQNYDSSEFASSSALFEDDDKLESIYKALHDLNEFTEPSNFKSYEELKTRLDYVLGTKGTPRFQDPETVAEEEEWERERRGESSAAPVPEDLRQQLSNLSSSSRPDEDEDEDDALSYFQKLAES
jgi:hypothetical protein